MSILSKVKFSNYPAAVTKALDLIDAPKKMPQKGLIILKPNLTNSDKPPVTTPVDIVEAVYLYSKKFCGKAEVAIGEGCGMGETIDSFEANGYCALAKKYGIRLIDFNSEETVPMKNPKAFIFKEFHMPRIAQDAFIISIPVLKDHSFTKTTIAMKNMFGLAPAPFYKSAYRGAWNKSKLHSPSTHKSVVDICLYKRPDLCVVDSVTALAGMHLAGTKKKIGLILASFDPVAIDALGSSLLGHDPHTIEYLKLSNGLLGSMDNMEIIEA